MPCLSHIFHLLNFFVSCLFLVKRLPTTRKNWVWSLGGEDPLENKMATHSSILAWRIPWMEEAGGLQSMGFAKSQTWLSDFTFTLSVSGVSLQVHFLIWLCMYHSYIGFIIEALFSSIQSLSRVRLFATPWTAACQASLSIANSQSSPKLMSIESVMPSNHLVLCHPLLLFALNLS